MRILTKQEEKIIRALQQKKYRDDLGLFVVEGEKGVQEALLSELKVKQLVVSEAFQMDIKHSVELVQCSEIQMAKISGLKTPPGILALVEIPKNQKIDNTFVTLVLDNVKDPGNLGTIIRTAEGLGISSIVCSGNTVDAFSPKVVQASMGSIFRVKIIYTALFDFLADCKLPIYGATLSGESVYKTPLQTPAVLVMGSESHGISPEIQALLSNPICIPMRGKIESFNVAIATSIILAEFQRQLILQ